MRLLQFKKESYEVTFTEECTLLVPFKRILDRDKSKNKELAVKEISFIYLYSDITSEYQAIIDKEERLDEIKKDINLPKNWKIDKILEEAIEFYTIRSRTIVHSLYDSAMIAASAINDVFSNAKNLINDSDDKIAATQKIITALEKVPKIMANLKEAEKELLKQIEEKDGKKLGSKTMNTFEDGLTLD